MEENSGTNELQAQNELQIQLANALSMSGSVGGTAQHTSGYMQEVQGNWGQQVGYYNWPWYYQTQNHYISNDEELLLNAIRRDDKIKTKVIKLAIAELLKSLDK